MNSKRVAGGNFTRHVAGQRSGSVGLLQFNQHFEPFVRLSGRPVGTTLAFYPVPPGVDKPSRVYYRADMEKSTAAQTLAAARWRKLKTKAARREATAAARAANRKIPAKIRAKIVKAATAGRKKAAAARRKLREDKGL